MSATVQSIVETLKSLDSTQCAKEFILSQKLTRSDLISIFKDQNLFLINSWNKSQLQMQLVEQLVSAPLRNKILLTVPLDTRNNK